MLLNQIRDCTEIIGVVRGAEGPLLQHVKIIQC